MGRVETPIFSGTSLEPHSLLVRTVGTIPGTFAAVAAARVVSVDEAARSITLEGTRAELFGDGEAGSSETVPGPGLRPGARDD